jgi:site-specific DNA-methyltransferase (adenine-specific)
MWRNGYGMLQQNMKDKEPLEYTQLKNPLSYMIGFYRITQSQGDLILDTHLGSQSSRIAANKAGLDFVGFEIDKEYFDNGNERYNNFISQLRMF